MSLLRGLFRFESRNTIIHRLDPRSKLIWVFSISVLTVLLGVPVLLVGIFLSTIPFWCILRPSKSKVKAMVTVFGTMIFGFMFSQSVFYYWGTHPDLTLVPESLPVIGYLTGGIHIYSQGVVYGLIQSFRFMAAISAAMVLVASTHPGDLIDGMTRFLHIGKRSIGMPYEVAFMVSSAVTFAPSLIEETIIVINAMRARGLEIKGFRGKLKAFRYIFFPMVIGVLRTGRRIAIAADARGFRATRNRTSIRQHRLKRPDYVLIAYSLAFMSAGIFISFIGYGGSVIR